MLGDRFDDLVREPALGLEEVVLGVVEAVLVVGADFGDDLCLGLAHDSPPPTGAGMNAS